MKLKNLKRLKNIICVYLMYDQNNTLLYVGKTTNFAGRLYNHFNPFELKEWKKEVSYIEYYPFNSKLDISIIELYLIATLNPKYNIKDSDLIGNSSIYSFDLPPKELIIDLFEEVNKPIKKEKTPYIRLSPVQDKIIEYIKTELSFKDRIKKSEIKKQLNISDRTWTDYMKKTKILNFIQDNNFKISKYSIDK